MLSFVITVVFALATNVASMKQDPSGIMGQYSFKPEAASQYWKSDIPILFNFNTSQFSTTVNGKAASTSYYTSSYITDTNHQQYFIISHILVSAENATSFSASTLNLTDLRYNSYMLSSNESGLQASSLLKVTLGDNGFESLTEDNVSGMRTYSTHDKAAFDITYNATSMALVDAATGLFTFGTGTSYEWGLPSCYTEGTLTIGGNTVTIDPNNSFTWYDRQWNGGFPSTGNWTWFELHIPATRYRLSIWAIDNETPYQRYRFATIRTEDGSQNVVPITFSPDFSRYWYSNASDTLYAQHWTVTVGSYASLEISSVTGNQEIVGPTDASSAYEGFVNFHGIFDGDEVEGFGVVEILHTQ
ncbi:hypothetical protein N7528_000844 [Penicillium herquei]|nr:hypothetical protein N7528_000844 [Penicillium herquei]